MTTDDQRNLSALPLDGHEPSFQVVRRALRASRDRRPGERDAEVIRELAVKGLQTLDALEALLRRIDEQSREAPYYRPDARLLIELREAMCE